MESTTSTTVKTADRETRKLIGDPIRELREQLAEIEMGVLTSYTLADAIREGCSVTTQKVGGYGAGREACAMSAAVIAAKARGYVK